MTNQERNGLLIIAESLKNMMTKCATGGSQDRAEYARLRLELMGHPETRAKLPRFVQTCRNPSEFWDFIQPKFAHYNERRAFIREQFEPLLAMLETSGELPADVAVSTMLSKVDSVHIQEAWGKALERRAVDPDGAITAARSLLETVCKHILDEEKVSYGDNPDLPKLYGTLAKHLNLAPSQHSEEAFKRILGGCHSVVDGLGNLRNLLSDAHGKSKASVKPAPRHAELAVNLAGTMALFLVETWEARRVSRGAGS
jgi:hypothetical protein